MYVNYINHFTMNQMCIMKTCFDISYLLVDVFQVLCCISLSIRAPTHQDAHLFRLFFL